MLDSLRDYRIHAKQLEKCCDYAELFSKVNREIIDGDLDKKKRGKKTSRYKVSSLFVEVTECLEKILHILKTLKVVSLTEIKHHEGKNLPPEDQSYFKRPEKIRSIYAHFN